MARTWSVQEWQGCDSPSTFPFLGDESSLAPVLTAVILPFWSLLPGLVVFSSLFGCLLQSGLLENRLRSIECREMVQKRVGSGLVSRKEELKRRCQTALQSRAEALLPASQLDSRRPPKCTFHPGCGLECQNKPRAIRHSFFRGNNEWLDRRFC